MSLKKRGLLEIYSSNDEQGIPELKKISKRPSSELREIRRLYCTENIHLQLAGMLFHSMVVMKKNRIMLTRRFLVNVAKNNKNIDISADLVKKGYPGLLKILSRDFGSIEIKKDRFSLFTLNEETKSVLKVDSKVKTGSHMELKNCNGFEKKSQETLNDKKNTEVPENHPKKPKPKLKDHEFDLSTFTWNEVSDVVSEDEVRSLPVFKEVSKLFSEEIIPGIVYLAKVSIKAELNEYSVEKLVKEHCQVSEAPSLATDLVLEILNLNKTKENEMTLGK